MKLKSVSPKKFSASLLVVSFGMFLSLSGLILFELTPTVAWGETAEEIQIKIAEQNAKIAALEKEIAEYESTLYTIGGEKTTLQGEINRIDVSRKKITATVSVTENKITAANLSLKNLGGAIEDKGKRIENSTETIRQSLRNLYQIGDTTIVEQLLAADEILEAWQEVDRIGQLGIALRKEIVELQTTKESLTVDYSTTEKEKAKLVSLKKQLSDQKILLDQNRKEQETLLAQTKNKESTFQKLLAEKQAAKAQFEKQLNDYEASLKYTLDPNSIPKAGSGVLSFPIDPAFMNRCKSRSGTFGNIYCLTQYFGNTDFAQSGAYNGKGHNGVDFGTPEGTRIVSALGGTVVDTGNTDLYKGCYSYGKWVFVRHENGLSTIYAHLSVISVVKGQSVSTGSLLGYSGKTGYATGPHLHFGVYVSSAAKVIRLGDVKSITKCGSAYMPVAPTEAYLNPMKYL
ncbi:MAG: peptidoglycan DD-metalloendopeptidase family protein [Patescibacteria group bacterium]